LTVSGDDTGTGSRRPARTFNANCDGVLDFGDYPTIATPLVCSPDAAGTTIPNG
jgi:hypothetical protein